MIQLKIIDIIIAILTIIYKICYNNSNRRRIIMAEFIWETPTEITLDLAKKLQKIRKRRKITQKQLADRSNVSYATLKKFEQTGQISLISLVKITMELGMADEIKALFSKPVYLNIDEVLNDE